NSPCLQTPARLQAEHLAGAGEAEIGGRPRRRYRNAHPVHRNLRTRRDQVTREPLAADIHVPARASRPQDLDILNLEILNPNPEMLNLEASPFFSCSSTKPQSA